MPPKPFVIDQLTAHYGVLQVLFGVSLTVAPGQLVALLGRNGMGKTTLIKSIMGLLKPASGEVYYGETALTPLASHRIAALGLGWVPEGREVFPTLTVRENLIATAANRHRAATPWNEERIYALFPPLKARRRQLGGLLSGGEQQMLAIARALMTNPTLLLLDEATEGLAPLVRQAIWQSLAQLKAEGLSILLVDKHLDALLPLADCHYVLEKGEVVWHGDSAALRTALPLVQSYLGVGAEEAGLHQCDNSL